MMGERTVAQEALFYEFSLERHVPADHLLRSIDRFVDLPSCASQLPSEAPLFNTIDPKLPSSSPYHSPIWRSHSLTPAGTSNDE